MKKKTNADNRSPWPACADCQIAENEAERGNDAPEDKATAVENTTNDPWGEVEPCEELGVRRDEVRRRVQEALARAHERAREASRKSDMPEQPERH